MRKNVTEYLDITEGLYSEKIAVEDANGCITFSNGEILYQGQRKDDLNDEIMKFQIRRTVEEHLRKELKLNKQGIKVLSLFFYRPSSKLSEL